MHARCLILCRSHLNSFVFLAIIVLSRWFGVGNGQDSGGFPPLPPGTPLPPPSEIPLITQLVNEELANLTRSFYPEVKKRFGFCIKDPEADYNQAFNFSSDLGFVVDCLANTPDLTSRLCTASEVKAYFTKIFSSGGSSGHVIPNVNCNLSTWISGCEPGWACSAGENRNLSLLDSNNIPSRTLECKPCCQGFFCPSGITCMIPCPLGAYCPLATLNEATGICDPYNYQLPPGQPNHTCGGADVWADVGSSSDLFCPAGSYCPSTIEKYNCSSGYYCRMGSIEQTRCIKTSSCKTNSGHQDTKIFGSLFIVALSLMLITVYNFYEQLLTCRERSQAKSRERAAKISRESVLARERWKAAKKGALKHALSFQNTVSRTFSHKGPSRQAELLKPQAQVGQSPEISSSEGNEIVMLSDRILTSEENNIGHDAFNAKREEKNIQKGTPKGRKGHTRTQIFRYAYDEIEKEKALQQEHTNLTLTDIISRATKSEIGDRPLIEITIKDLNLVLKRNKKKLLTYVSGKLIPGRITAVMGPSGAGKTTFLTALSGKTAGCEVTGLVLINGKKESIRSYKKIIGFVPQDDIVHGNLTVEENLWFSARCRLSSEIPQAHKVLVVERTIESLGLQAVRDSLVGTVEKRGISGGQRKRVNVGLEMVMEPSLLILDEPTSGLDSSSSQLLLRALRREALAGVNICAVIHQPSYTLFNMFDDLILLAKGGTIVYHGPVCEVESYFCSLGINVPDRVNPPDYYIDILEGMLKPNSINVGIKCSQLPLIWMLHNGYNIPPELQDELDNIDSSLRDSQSSSARSQPNEHPSSSNVWGNLVTAIEEKQDHLKNNFSRSKDLSYRQTPGKIVQYRHYLGRVSKQRLREAGALVVDLLILCLAGVCLGLLAKVNDAGFGVLGYTYTVIAVSLLCKIAALRSFSLEKLQFMRERTSGMSSLAYFLARDTIDHFNTAIKPIVYLSMFYYFTDPRSSFTDNYVVLLALVYCVTGFGYILSICFQPSSAQLWAALLPVIFTLVATQLKTSPVTYLCYPKWALEAFVVANAERYPGVWLITRCGALYNRGYNINYWGLCIGMLFLYGVVFRCIAFICMVVILKK